MPHLRQEKYRHDYRVPEYTITDIDLNFELRADISRVTATSTVKRLVEQDSVPLVLQGEELTLLTLQVNGENWPHYQQEEGQLVIYALPPQFTLTVVNEIYPQSNSALEGLYCSGETLCTQCEAEGFRRITYYLDRPDVLARFRTRIIANKARYPFLLSNGNRCAQGEYEDGRHWVQWEDPFPKPSYLFALVAGNFDLLRDTFITRSGRSVDLELYVDQGNLDRAEWAMTSLKNAMKWDEERFDLEYDLDIYMIVAVDFFNMGAMENKGLNVFNAKYVLAKAETATDRDYLNIESVIGHEYFHNWTGNRVTCRDWFQLSLKEGLTVFRDQEFSADLGSRGVQRIQTVRTLRSLQFAEDAGPMAHPIRPDKVIEMNNFYTMTVYEKGAEVIRMLHTLLGESKFQLGMKLYFSRYDGQAVTCDDFVQAMEDASAVDLTQFRLWYSQSGTPIVTVRDEYDAEQQRYLLHISQQTPITADQKEKHPLHIPLNIELYNAQGQVLPLRVEGKSVSSVLSITSASQTLIFEQITEKPTPSLLRNFSAPVKLDYPYSDQQLVHLMQHAQDDFTRWDAAQMLLAKYIRMNVECYQQKPLSLPLHIVDAFRAILLHETIDPALAAQILTLPSENEIAELFTIIDPDAIAEVRKMLQQTLAVEMQDEWLAVLGATKTTGYRIVHHEMARRDLHNICLKYLAVADEQLGSQLVQQQYYSADNMTDSFSALTAAVEGKLLVKDQLLEDFNQRWRHDGLVMDKWFTLQATAPLAMVLEKIRGLMQHPAFDFTNPNRVRSLIGAFCSGNPRAFHAVDGSGYLFLYDVLIKLNQQNPQIASRLIEPLIRFKRYDQQRQNLMRNVLETLKGQEGLSSDLYEKITKALE